MVVAAVVDVVDGWVVEVVDVLVVVDVDVDRVVVGDEPDVLPALVVVVVVVGSSFVVVTSPPGSVELDESSVVDVGCSSSSMRPSS